MSDTEYCYYCARLTASLLVASKVLPKLHNTDTYLFTCRLLLILIDLKLTGMARLSKTVRLKLTINLAQC